MSYIYCSTSSHNNMKLAKRACIKCNVVLCNACCIDIHQDHIDKVVALNKYQEYVSSNSNNSNSSSSLKFFE